MLSSFKIFNKVSQTPPSFVNFYSFQWYQFSSVQSAYFRLGYIKLRICFPRRVRKGVMVWSHRIRPPHRGQKQVRLSKVDFSQRVRATRRVKASCRGQYQNKNKPFFILNINIYTIHCKINCKKSFLSSHLMKFMYI